MKTALVTGANKGIGREVALELAKKGFHMFIGARNRHAGRKAAEEVAKQGGQATFLEININDNESVTASLNSTRPWFPLRSWKIGTDGATVIARPLFIRTRKPGVK